MPADDARYYALSPRCRRFAFDDFRYAADAFFFSRFADGWRYSAMLISDAAAAFADVAPATLFIAFLLFL